jgi:hypothetical protein
MPIEKAFAIKAPPREIYAALERDLESARAHAGDTFEVIRRDASRSMELRVTIGGVPCWLTYTLTPKDGHTEVVAWLVPFGWKYAFFRIITLGMRNQNYEIALVEGLANLKAAVEDDDDTDPGAIEDELTIDE